jgi:hypothetical protein
MINNKKKGIKRFRLIDLGEEIDEKYRLKIEKEEKIRKEKIEKEWAIHCEELEEAGVCEFCGSYDEVFWDDDFNYTCYEWHKESEEIRREVYADRY